MKKETKNTIAIVTFFSIAMAFLETAVVIYLRNLYYPQGFTFPLRGFIEPGILNIEWVREIATIVMLACIGLLAAKKPYEKFAYFIYSFAVWDIFYYVFLKLSLNWPSSLLTWDLLFLVPLPWIGPVIAPIIISLTMVLLSFIILSFQKNITHVRFNTREIFLLILGCIVVLYTFLYDYTKMIIGRGFAKEFFTLTLNPSFTAQISSYVPTYFNWNLFALGELCLLLGISLFYKRTNNHS